MVERQGPAVSSEGGLGEGGCSEPGASLKGERPAERGEVGNMERGCQMTLASGVCFLVLSRSGRMVESG